MPQPSASGSTNRRSLQMVVVRIRRMVRDDNIRLRITDGSFDVLHQLKMRHRVHLDVRERALILLAHTYVCQCLVRIILQLIIFRPERPRLCLRAHDTHIHCITITRPLVNGCATSQDLVIRMRYYYKILHNII